MDTNGTFDRDRTPETFVVQQPMTLGQVIRDGRRAKGWTQESLARTIAGGTTQSDISRLERDKITLPRRDRLERIARALDIPLGELLASSGWAAADQFFDQRPPDGRQAPADGGAQPDSSRSEPAGQPTPTRLQEALAHSRTLREHTDQLLEQSWNAARYWERSLQRQEPEIEPDSASDNR
jgi:transcriptional regulator with XRE-family HTH domain